MDQKTQQQLDKAIEFLYDCKLPEAYNLFRRYFDQLPFRLDDHYANYIGMFVRCLLELGKEHELDFYLPHFEKAYENTHSVGAAYQLATVYAHMSNAQPERSRQLFESILRQPDPKDFIPKAKIMLASHHLERKNVPLATQLIESINRVDDIRLQRIVEIWRAIIRRHQKRREEALQIIRSLLGTFDQKEDWYAYFSAKTAEARILLEMGRTQEVSAILESIRKATKGKRCKTLQTQIEVLLKRIRETNPFGTLQLLESEQGSTVVCGERTLFVEKTSREERMLLQLIKKRFLSKEQVIRAYRKLKAIREGRSKRLPSSMDFIRKCLEDLGLPKGALQPNAGGFRLLSTVRIDTEEK